MTHDELEQRLWELEYGLLTEEEGAALREQISADPDAAQSYGRIRAQLALISQASRIEESRIELRTPSDVPAEQPAEQTGAGRRTSKSRTVPQSVNYLRIRRAANWTIGVAASLLLGVLGWATLDRSQPADRQVVQDSRTSAEPEPVLIRVDTPQAFSRESKNPITVWTSAPDGTPQSTELRFVVQDSAGSEYFYKDVRTGPSGRATLELPKAVDDLAKLNVAAAADSRSPWRMELPAAQIEYATHVSTDKPRYRPGDVVRYRSVTLSRFGLKADWDVSVSYSITDPAGQEIVGASLSGTTEHGVGNGEFLLAPESESGRYTLIARSPTNVFPEARRDFTVQKPTPRQYELDVHWDKPVFEAGEQAQGQLAVRTLLGEPASDVPVNLRAYVDGRQMELQPAGSVTDGSGQTHFGFALPPQIASSKGDFGIQLGEQDVVWKDIPLQADQVYVDFYPEGGDLVAGVESRVYFHSHDFDGRAVAIQGEIVDAAGQVVAKAATEHEGRGSFRLTPQPATTYSLVINEPDSISSRPALPAAVDESRLVLDAGPGVFPGGSPVRLHLRSRTPPSDFSVVAICRGVTVGQLSGTSEEFQNGVCELTLPVIDDAAGVVRITVFDYSKQTPEPLAERLVYRHPLRKLNLRFDGLNATYKPGDTVAGEVIATNENGEPVSTMLGLSAIDEMVWQLADPPPPRLSAHFYLSRELSQPEKLEDVNAYLAEDSETTVALDLVLGTQGWRRFERVSAMGMAGRSFGIQDGLVLRRSGGLDGAGYDAASVEEARRNKADLDVAGTPALPEQNLADNSAAGMLGGFGTSRLVEATEEAPKRFLNRIEVESLETSRGETSSDRLTPRFSTLHPRRLMPWVIAACAGLALVLVCALVIRRHPTKRTLWATAGMLGAVAVLSAVIWPVYWLSRHGNPVARGGTESVQAESATSNQAGSGPTATMRAKAPASGTAQDFFADSPPAETAAVPSDSTGARPAPRDEPIPDADFAIPAPQSPGAAPAANAPADLPTAEKSVAEEMTRTPKSGKKATEGETEKGTSRDVESKVVPLPEGPAVEKPDAKKVFEAAPIKQKAVPPESAEPSNAPLRPAPAMRAATPPPPAPAPTPARPQVPLAPASPPVVTDPAPAQPVPAKEPPPKPAAAASRARSPAASFGQDVAPKGEVAGGAPAAAGLAGMGGGATAGSSLKKERFGDLIERSQEFDPRKTRMNRKADDELEKRLLMEQKYVELQDQLQAESKRLRQATESNQSELGKATLNKAVKSQQGKTTSGGIPVVPGVADAESSRSIPALKAEGREEAFVIRRFANVRAKDNRRNETDFDFSESVLWNPLIVTDDGGRAAFQFDLPDTITRFRVMADGHSAGRLGSADRLIESTRENK